MAAPEMERRPDLLGGRRAAGASNGHAPDYTRRVCTATSKAEPERGKPAEVSFEEAKAGFLLDRQSSRCSAKTLQWYRDRFAALRLALTATDVSLSPKEWTPTALREAFRWLAEEAPNCRGGRLAAATVHGTFRVARTLTRFLVAEGKIEVAPMAGMAAPRLPLKLPMALTAAELCALLRAPDRSRRAGLRDATMIALLVDSGLRLGELLALRGGDLNWASSTLRVMGKGARERDVPLGRKARRLLGRWLRTRGDGKADERIFVTGAGLPVSQRNFQRALRRYAERAGVRDGHVWPHLLRHTCATHLLTNGCDLAMVARVLGHARFETTRRYLHLCTDDLVLAHGKASPLDRLGEGE